MGGSQLKQLKEALSSSNLTPQSGRPSKKRKRTSIALDKQADKAKRAAKLQNLHEKFNQFDKVRVTKLKHDVGGRKLKGVTGKPLASRQAGIEQRKKTLLHEFNEKGKTGAIIDRRFGENDPTLSLEERMLERFTRERQRSTGGSKATLFNLDDDEEGLTHYGQSLSKLDDFDDAGLTLDDDEEDAKGQIDADTVRKVHFGGFSDDEEDQDDDGPPRKKTKAEVMAEVMAKSKEHKYERQQQKEEDEKTREQLDLDFDSIRGILFSNTDQPPEIEMNEQPVTQTEEDYDKLVRELVFDKRAQPKNRTKTEEELAIEEKEALEKAERARLKRMMGEEDDSESDGHGGRRSRSRVRGGDDLDDDFNLGSDDEEGWDGIGAGLSASTSANPVKSNLGASSGEDDDDSSAGSEEEDDDSSASNADSEEEDGSFRPLVSAKDAKPKSKASSKQLPFTFPCPKSHDELLDILEGTDDKDLGTILERIRKLYHPSLAEGNKGKLQVLNGVILDHILYVTSASSGIPSQLSTLNQHLSSLTTAYPQQSAQAFVKKLNLMQKNLTRGLQSPLSAETRTFPGTAELVLLKTLGELWSTSDMKHPVVGPARYLMAAYLDLARVRSVKDIASGLCLCSLLLDYESDSKRFIPEAINFAVTTILLLLPPKSNLLPGVFPTEDVFKPYTKHLAIKLKKHNTLSVQTPNLFTIVNEDHDTPEVRLGLVQLTMSILGRFAEMYKSLDGFIELFEPIVEVFESIEQNKLPKELTLHITAQIDLCARLLKFAHQSRQPLTLQSHKPLPIATYIPKFTSSSSSYMRARDADFETQQAQKLKAQYKKEKKGAMRELRKDNKFLAGVVQERKDAEDKRYKESMKRAFSSLESERAEQRREEKEKMKAKRRAGK